MEKSSKDAKNVIGPPAIAPIRDVEYGCEHIQEFLSSSNTEIGERLKKAYIELLDLTSNPLEAQTIRDPKDPKKHNLTQLRPTFPCLQCKYIASYDEKAQHFQSKRHGFSVESRSGHLFCAQCDDFVYDPLFERLRLQNNQPQTTNTPRKRKFSSLYAQLEDDQYILPNANNLSCAAGAPRGLFNLGQTCYMSVILQGMVHNPMMRNFFLANRHEPSECEVETCVACGLSSLLVEMLTSEKVDGYGPVELLYKSWKNDEELEGYKQQDAHQYFQSILDQLHNSSGCTNHKLSKDCNCLYHQTFFGKLRSTVTCLQCRNVTEAEDPIVDLSLDLRHQVKRRKLEGGKAAAEAPLDLETCLKNFTTPEKLGADAYKCKSDRCQDTHQRARKHMTIKRLPPTLCIQLKRYEKTHEKKDPQKLDTRLNFPLQLDMSPFTTRNHKNRKFHSTTDPHDPGSPYSSRSPGWYDLSSVVIHIGQLNAGHYVCYCRRGDQWLKFDDNKVMLADTKEVLAAEAYLLFYVVRNLGSGAGRRDRDREAMNGKEEMEFEGAKEEDEGSGDISR